MSMPDEACSRVTQAVLVVNIIGLGARQCKIVSADGADRVTGQRAASVCCRCS